MAKSKRHLLKTATAYIDELKARFPDLDLEAEAELGGFEGFDVWIRIELPSDFEDRIEDVIYATTELNFKFWDETGVSTTATVEEKEAVHG
jgi:hypothetical protein